MIDQRYLSELFRVRNLLRCECCLAPAEAQYATEGDGPFWLCDKKDKDHEEQYSGEEVFRFLPMKLCECGAVPVLHEYAVHPDCEYSDHHCDLCHEKQACTAKECSDD